MIRVETRDPALAHRLRDAIDAAQRVDVPAAEGIAVIVVTRANRKDLVACIEHARANGAPGIQLVWDGADRARTERHVFAALEHARATQHAAPVVLADSEEPVPALCILVHHRRHKS